MKIVLDSNTGEVKVGSKTYKDLNDVKKNSITGAFRSFLKENTQLTDYEEDSAWMSWRYCIGRHTIAASSRAGDIWANCKGRMSKDDELFNAFDINREIENQLRCMKPCFWFPITFMNRIYSTAVDIVCEFMEDFNIESIDDFIKYKDIHIKLGDNNRGYYFEVVTWEEWLRPEVWKIVSDYYGNKDMSVDFAWKYFETWKSGKEMQQKEVIDAFEKLTSKMPKAENYYMHDFEDLFIWNDLVHCFDHEHHHKSILVDGSECVWFWGWKHKTEKCDDNQYRKVFGYDKVRILLESWNGNNSPYIPKENIKEDIY